MAASIGDRHLQLKEQLWLVERVFQYGSIHKGCHLQFKEQFSLAEPLAILEEPFASYLKLEMQIGGEIGTELTLRGTLNAA